MVGGRLRCVPSSRSGLGFRNQLPGAKLSCFSPPLSHFWLRLRAPHLWPREQTGVFEVLYFRDNSKEAHALTPGRPGRAARLTPGLADPGGGGRPRFPSRPPRRFPGDAPVPAGSGSEGPRATGARSRRGRGAWVGPGSLPSEPPGLCALRRGRARTLPARPDARGRYSRSRLSRQSAVQPRGIPRPARAPLPTSILPAPLRRDALSPRRARPAGRAAPALRPGAGWASWLFPLPSLFIPGKAGPSPWPPLP